jgi:hypothetical protein
MESFSTYPRQHRGHDGNTSAGRRGTFKNKTWIAGDRSGSSTPFPPGHLGADGPRWERGGARGFARGRGRGKGRSPRPDLDPSQHPSEDASEQEDNADAGATNGAEARRAGAGDVGGARAVLPRGGSLSHTHVACAVSGKQTRVSPSRARLFL